MEIDAKKIEELCERLEKRAAFWERYWTGRSLQDPDSGPIREAAALIRSQAAALAAEKRAREEAEAKAAHQESRAALWKGKADAALDGALMRAEAAETHSAELAKVLENILDTYRRVYYMPKPGDGKLMWKAIDEGRVILKTNGGR